MKARMEIASYVRMATIEMVALVNSYHYYVETVCIIHKKDVMMEISNLWMDAMKFAR